MLGTNLGRGWGCGSQSRGQHMGRGGGVSEKQETLRTGLGEMLPSQWSQDK